MIKFPHINALYQVARYVKKINRRVIVDPGGDSFEVVSPVRFRGTVKLHGSSASVVCSGEKLVPQSRNRQLSIENDNNGFASFCSLPSITQKIREIEQKIRQDHNIEPATKVVLYGEIIGPGIQRGMAINQLSLRQWVLFATKTIDQDDNQKWINAVPKLNKKYKQIHSVYDINTWSLEVDFENQEKKEDAIKQAEIYTQEVENLCPWGKYFGIEGMGEGIVWTPICKDWGNSDLFFKTKGEKHKGTEKSKKQKNPIDPETLSSINEFLDFSLTENRLNQGIEYLNEMNHPIEMKSTSHFLKWICQDIKRECELELQDNNLEWKIISKAISARALEFFKKIAMSI